MNVTNEKPDPVKIKQLRDLLAYFCDSDEQAWEMIERNGGSVERAYKEWAQQLEEYL